MSPWRFQRGKYPRQEEIKGAALTGSSKLPVELHAQNAASSVCLTERVRLAAHTMAVRLSRHRKTKTIEMKILCRIEGERSPSIAICIQK